MIRLRAIEEFDGTKRPPFDEPQIKCRYGDHAIRLQLAKSAGNCG
jgi:hypothetical protein